jgi:hypothetical protein
MITADIPAGVQLTYLRTELAQIQLRKVQHKRGARVNRRELVRKIEAVIKKLERRPGL